MPEKEKEWIIIMRRMKNKLSNHEERSPVDIAEHITLGRATFHFLWTGSCEEFRHGRLTDQQANLICLIALLVPFHPFLFPSFNFASFKTIQLQH